MLGGFQNDIIEGEFVINQQRKVEIILHLLTKF